ncbi:Purine permease [Wickerhamomyces ciferrii]|uniref:Purine permease n=1 Tax=Wickerhamomyces ciferrii (strain ATCC 14091 / BCRC 22168 / CBS 111 / JCM 3599 / NBRC 0793 / NRRL Y-1031 F-60-10) TaxID=1206466 RepID=K0KLX3_WICCF|nr:Purine permease [Wickerhamomyces ciferrii]CCH42123.1 Purine permease [Wickerhamomyces ciferrii]
MVNMLDLKSTPQRIFKKFTTKSGLIGDYNYAHLFTPKLPFKKTSKDTIQPFFGLNSDMPIVLGFLLGLQHALSMLAGVVSPPIIIASAANLDTESSQYLVSASLIISGLLSLIQITRFHIIGTKYYVGTGLVSVVGTSFATITIVNKAFPMMYKTGMCPTAEDGTMLPCPEGYGAILGTGCICALLEILLSFMPPRILQKIFPNLVTGPVVLIIGIHLIGTGFQDWLGGSGCSSGKTLCPSDSAPHALSWGSAEFIGLGFLVFVVIIICEKWGAPIMKSCAVIIGLLVGCIVAAATNYFDRSGIDKSPAVTFLWVHTFKLSVYGPAVLPMLATYIVLMMEAIGDITATCDVSRLETDGEIYDSRIQGGVLADGLNGLLSCLGTMTPVSTFAQNNGVISITKCANRMAGYWCCFFLIIMGVFAKFSAALVSIPKAVLGGMTTFLFTSVTVSGLAIISSVPFTRRNRFVLTCSLLFGLGATLVDDWFSNVFTYSGDNKALQGFLNAIVLVLETGYALTGFVGVILNLFISEEPEPEETTYLEGEETHELSDQSVIEGGSDSIGFDKQQGSKIDVK